MLIVLFFLCYICKIILQYEVLIRCVLHIDSFYINTKKLIKVITKVGEKYRKIMNNSIFSFKHKLKLNHYLL